MVDEEHSAHQFSKRSISIQADEEERLDAEFQMSVISKSPKSKLMSPKSWGKSKHTVVSIPSKRSHDRNKSSLLKQKVDTSEMAIQTDRNSDFNE